MEDLRTNTAIQPKAKVVDITPHKAERWLKSNRVNRAISKNQVEKYASDMAAGRWDLNAETIKLDIQGNLLDGQHRLYACIKAGVPFKALVATGLPLSAIKNVDIGKTRSLANRLELMGKRRHATHLASITKWVAEYKARGASTRRMTNEDFHAVFTEHEAEITFAAEFVNERRRVNTSDFSLTALGTALFIISEVATVTKSSDPPNDFIDQAMTGENLTRTSPVFTIRKKMKSIRDQGLSITTDLQVGLLIRGWNAMRQGRSLGRVYLQGATGETSWKDIKVAR